jgi:methionyl-tRNA formyltransferase
MLECATVARIVFMGTPEFAVPSLLALLRAHAVVGVVSQPDRPAGRGRQLLAPPVKAAALAAGVPVIQPRRLSEPAALQQLRAWSPDLIVVTAFGQILKPAVLDLPPVGCLNVHASLLPRHRGAAPIAAAILAGDAETGITLMRMDPGLDTGPILTQTTEPITPGDTAGSLAARLSELGADLLITTLPRYLSGDIAATPQDNSQATYAPQLKKHDGRLDFARPSVELARRVRAFNPWPGAFAVMAASPDAASTTLKVLRAEAVEPAAGLVGEVIETPQGPTVVCGRGALLLLEVQPPGKRPMPAADFARGARGFVGSQLPVTPVDTGGSTAS